MISRKEKNNRNSVSVASEALFLDIFSDVFGPEKTDLLYPQYEFRDVYQNIRYADFMFSTGGKHVAIEIDGEAVHNQKVVSLDKFDDDHIKQNSMISYGWDIYRWSYRKLKKKADTVKDEMQLYFGDNPKFKQIKDYLPKQNGELLTGEFNLRKHQEDALANLAKMREENKTIALICHATGVGKTATAILDAKSVNGKTLFLAHTKDLVYQPAKDFNILWNTQEISFYVDGQKDKSGQIVCGSVQSVALNLDDFEENEFDYIIVDEAHHASSETYQKIIAYFNPKFLLGMTATEERADNQDILEIFRDVAHRLDIETAVENGQLVPVRCIRIKTNIDISNVRFNGVKYNAQDLENKLFVPERNKLIVDTCLEYGKDRHTVIFCVSVKHAEKITELLQENGVNAVSVSGNMDSNERKELFANYEEGRISVLCACDLLNEGWDSPKTDLLFMARPTMSKLLYTQQLGRGMRLAEGKADLMVFDFVDNANMFNSAYSLHKMAGKNQYREGGIVFGSAYDKDIDEELYRKGEKPDSLLDFPISAMDYEIIDIFNWQKEAEGTKSQMAFVRMVDVQSEAIEKRIKNGKIIADLEVPISQSRKFRYFKEETIEKYAKEFGWKIITESMKNQLFMDYISKMDMSYSYKPVLVKAILKYIDEKGRVKLDNIVEYFIEFYENRRAAGKIVEKKTSLYAKGDYSSAKVKRNILANPYNRFEEMSMLRHTKTLGIIELDKAIWKKLTKDDLANISKICEEKLSVYYGRIEK